MRRLHFRVHQLRLDDLRLDDLHQLVHQLVRPYRHQNHLGERHLRQPDEVHQIRYRLDDLREVHQIRYRQDDLHEVHLLRPDEVRLGQLDEFRLGQLVEQVVVHLALHLRDDQLAAQKDYYLALVVLVLIRKDYYLALVHQDVDLALALEPKLV